MSIHCKSTNKNNVCNNDIIPTIFHFKLSINLLIKLRKVLTVLGKLLNQVLKAYCVFLEFCLSFYIITKIQLIKVLD